MELWSHLLVKIAELPFNLNNRKFVQRAWVRFSIMLKIGKPNIAILGRSAVGKTVLSSHLKSMTGKIDFKLPDASPDVEIDHLDLAGWSKVICVVPGQTGFERNIALHKLFQQNVKLDGVIYVVDYGYTIPRETAEKNQFLKEKQLDNIEKLRNYNLELELKDFKAVLDEVVRAHSIKLGPKWFLIAVTKIDLFYPKLDDAQTYYHPEGNSSFTKILDDALLQIGTNQMRFSAAPITSFGDPFVWNGTSVPSSVGGDAKKLAILSLFLSQVSKLLKLK